MSSMGKEREVFLEVRESEDPAFLKECSKSKNSEIRRMAAGNEFTAVASLDCLADDEHFEVRLAVAKNINASKEALAKLARDDSKMVAEAVMWRLAPTPRPTEYAYDAYVTHADGVTVDSYGSSIRAHVQRQVADPRDRELEMFDTIVDAHCEAVGSHMRVHGEIPAKVEIQLIRRIENGAGDGEDLPEITFAKLNAILAKMDNYTPPEEKSVPVW
jgi:hypothetical protein